MLIVDENISEVEIWRLREWRIHVRLISEVAFKGVADENIIPVLHRLKRPTLFSKDHGFWNRKLIHPGYCLVLLDVPEHEGEVARHARQFLKHPDFASNAHRMGKVVRVHVEGIEFWEKGLGKARRLSW
jgi:hypothetical protein